MYLIWNKKICKWKQKTLLFDSISRIFTHSFLWINQQNESFQLCGFIDVCCWLFTAGCAAAAHTVRANVIM